MIPITTESIAAAKAAADRERAEFTALTGVTVHDTGRMDALDVPTAADLLAGIARSVDADIAALAILADQSPTRADLERQRACVTRWIAQLEAVQLLQGELLYRRFPRFPEMES